MESSKLKASVSILIPVYNAEPYVAAALDSVLAQTWPWIEVIAVNDGSTDGSRSILARYEDRIKVIDQQNKGQCAAANRAYAASTGELIKFFDADDIMAPEMIARQVERLGARQDAVALGELTRFYGPTPENEKFYSLQMYRDAKPIEWLTAEWMNSLPMMQCGLWLLPRNIVDRAGTWDERLTLINDFEYFARLLTSASDIVFAPLARMYYRSGIEGSLSRRKSRIAVESQFLSLILGTGHLLAAENNDRTRRASANMIQQFIFEHYPDHSDLCTRASERVKELGGADVAPIGPPNFHRLRRVLGWRTARRIQKVFGR